MKPKLKRRRLPRPFRAEHATGITTALLLIVGTLLILPFELMSHAGTLLAYLAVAVALATGLMVMANSVRKGRRGSRQKMPTT
jgi:hypothetical protein